MGTADEDEVEAGGAAPKADRRDNSGTAVSDEGGDSDPDASSDDATGQAQAAENRDRESPS